MSSPQDVFNVFRLGRSKLERVVLAGSFVKRTLWTHFDLGTAFHGFLVRTRHAVSRTRGLLP